MKRLVTGATGNIGSLVTERLVDAGAAVAMSALVSAGRRRGRRAPRGPQPPSRPRAR